jgi:hypothetical protein
MKDVIDHTDSKTVSLIHENKFDGAETLAFSPPSWVVIPFRR